MFEVFAHYAIKLLNHQASLEFALKLINTFNANDLTGDQLTRRYQFVRQHQFIPLLEDKSNAKAVSIAKVSQEIIIDADDQFKLSMVSTSSPKKVTREHVHFFF